MTFRALITFNLVPPVETSPVPGYAKDSKDTTGTQDGKAAESATAQTARFRIAYLEAAPQRHHHHPRLQQRLRSRSSRRASGTNYADFLYDSTGRFIYVSVTKKF